MLCLVISKNSNIAGILISNTNIIVKEMLNDA